MIFIHKLHKNHFKCNKLGNVKKQLVTKNWKDVTCPNCLKCLKTKKELDIMIKQLKEKYEVIFEND